MTVELDWPPEVVDRIVQEARTRGLSLDAYVLRAVLQQSCPIGTVEREESGRRIRESRKGNILGSGLTIRELVEEGRRASLERPF